MAARRFLQSSSIHDPLDLRLDRYGERRIRDTWPSFSRVIRLSARSFHWEIRAYGGRSAGSGAARGAFRRTFPAAGWIWGAMGLLSSSFGLLRRVGGRA
jgi:hypothetical protein